jgi:polyhydroxyalkanoate synthase subunit PhaC
VLEFALLLGVTIGLAILLVTLHLRYWVERLTLAVDYAFEAELATPDGASIGLRRVPPVAGRPAADLPPVLLVHGLAANHRNQDIHPDYSLARYLAALGRDVWLLTLRSGLPVPRSRRDRRLLGFEAMAEHDVPLAVATVLQETGRTALDYVGFSMGGMLLFAALGRSIAETQLRRVVVVGSPGLITAPRWLRPLLRILPRAVTPRLPFRFWARVTAFASEWFATPLHGLVVNPLNVSPGITRASLVNCIEDVPAALNADLINFMKCGGTLVMRGAPALDGLRCTSTPALFVAGSSDQVAPASAVRHAFDAWARDRPETPKRFMVLGRDFGHREDYGHGDLVLGAHVGVELFEPIARFLGPDVPFEQPGERSGEAAVEDIERRPAE